MKKILYIGNNLTSGNPTTLLQLSEILKDNGFEVLVYSNKKSKLFRLMDMFIGVLKNLDAQFILIDTYSTWNFYYAVCISQLARLVRIKYIPITHGGNLPNRLKKNRFLSRLIFKNAFITICPSNYLKLELDGYQFKTLLIPNALQIDQYPFSSNDFSQPKLVWVRAFDAIYNPIMALEVLVEVKKKYPLATLCMVGPDKDGSMEKATSFIAAHNLEDSVELTGYLTKKEWIAIATRCNFFINTSTIDNTPVSVMEAMALGLPVISTDVGGLRFLITSTENGILVENGNSTHMANALLKLIGEPLTSTTMALNARMTVENFDTKVVGEQWKNLLNNDA